MFCFPFAFFLMISGYGTKNSSPGSGVATVTVAVPLRALKHKDRKVTVTAHVTIRHTVDKSQCLWIDQHAYPNNNAYITAWLQM